MRRLNYSLGLTLWLALTLAGCKKSEPPAAAPAPTASAPSQSNETITPPPSQAPAVVENPAPSGEPVLLQVKWPVGNRYTYRMDLNQRSTNTVPQMPKPIQQDVNLSITYALSVQGDTTNGGHQVELEFLANEMEIKMANQVMMSFDSKEAEKADAQNPITTPFRKMIGSKLQIIMSQDGKVEQVVNYQDWAKTLSQGVNGPMGGLIMQQFNEGFIRQIASFGAGLPDKAVQPGESWPFKMEVPAGPLGKISVESTVRFKGWEDHEQHKCVFLNFQGTLGSIPVKEATAASKTTLEHGSVSGDSWFDPALGALIESSQDQLMRITGDVPGAPGGMSFTTDLGQKVIVKLVELGKTKP